ncbi:MAG: hypothetical protein ACXV5S_00320 [Acidimicrobiales bacterium]
MHVMRTGGSTFRGLLQQQFGRAHVYPDTRTDLDLPAVAESTHNPFGHRIEDQAALDSYISIDRLLRVPDERRAEVRAYVGHFPFVVTELMGIDLVIVSLLREPVERTISQLRTAQVRRQKFADASLEEIYEDGFEFPFFVHNHQAKVFAMEPGDRLESVLDVVDIDERRLAVAKANLEKVDVLGLQDRYPAFLAEIGRRFGWQIEAPPDLTVTCGDQEVPASFRPRIAEAHAADIALVHHARRLLDQR